VTALHELGALELRERFRARELSPVEVLEACATRIEETAEFNTFVTLALDEARERAREAERAYAAGEAEERPLLGIPVAVKDLFDTAGLRTTYGSAMFARHVPRADAEVVARLREAGALIVGKTSLFEFAWGISSQNTANGDCLNPWDAERSAGGSSGGSAAALALRQVPLALGTDTAGSIRIPAAFCGVMGLKPTVGRLSAEGVFPLAPSLDHVGPMARRPEDIALAMGVLDGGHWRHCERPPLRVAVWHGPPDPELDDDTAKALDAAADALVRQGGRVERVSGLEVDDAVAPFATIQLVEALESHQARGLYPRRSDEYTPQIAKRLERGRAVRLGDYLSAGTARRAIASAFARLFRDWDILLSPISPVPPPKLGEESEVRSGRARGLRDAVLGFTVPESIAGLPACAVRASIGSDGLPRAVQIAGPRGSDRRVLAAAAMVWGDNPELQSIWPEPAVSSRT
jgi:aspartyl-tRNA(Asn)/glutamyl-tRNA(Gln) amidotransferase subunit A